MKRRILFLMVIFAVIISTFGAQITDTSASGKGYGVRNDVFEKDYSAIARDALNLKHTLQFNKQGKFKIVIFSDIQDTYPVHSDTLKLMNRVLEQEKPDLVLLGGDNHRGDLVGEQFMKTYLDAISKPMETRKIPWAQVYGNHVEGGYGYSMNGPTKERQQELFESFPYNVSKAGTVDGVGNYVIPILRSDSDKVGFNVFMLDSHSYLNNYISGLESKLILPNPIYSGRTYDCIHFNQIKWYWDTSVALEKYNGSLVPAMMLFHIAIPEGQQLVNNPKETNRRGEMRSEFCSAEVSAGLFQACFERGDVKGIFWGHDHNNDATGVYMGIKLVNVPTAGYGTTYSAKTIGARIVEIDQNDAFNFTTRMVYGKDL